MTSQCWEARCGIKTHALRDMCSSCDPGLCLPRIYWARQVSPLAYLESNTCQRGSNNGCGPLGLISLHSPDNSEDPFTSRHTVHTQFAHHFQELKDIFQCHCSIAEPQYSLPLHSADKETEAEIEYNLQEVYMNHSRIRPRLLASTSGFTHRHSAAATCFIYIPDQLPFSKSCLVMERMSDNLFPTCDSSFSKT